MNRSDQLLALAVIQQVELQRLATWTLKDVLAQLRELAAEISAIVLRRDAGGATRPSARLRRASVTSYEVDEAIQRVLREISNRVESDFQEAGEIVAEAKKANWLALFGAALLVEDLEGKPELSGTRVRDYFDRIADDYSFQVGSAVRDAVSVGATSAEVVDRIAGREDAKVPRAPIAAKVERSVEVVVRTGTSAVLSDVESRAEPKIDPHGWMHVSVLDSRTTDICRARAWLRWDADHNPIGHSTVFAQPPLHVNCRSVITLIMLEDAEPAQVTFFKFVNSLRPDAAAELFGAKKLRDWRNGVISDGDLIRQQSRPLSLSDLRDRSLANLSQGALPFGD